MQRVTDGNLASEYLFYDRVFSVLIKSKKHKLWNRLRIEGNKLDDVQEKLFQQIRLGS
ncbi:hypothetical protein [Konateibacter massiliensis]|uniref:hypothetical protein n=1 Tax=Konateibacter massiliensis TaxID=2002841 RepID=UPI0015D4C179|nr:hypothetical protein [Konateibacter massiliensis]